jgi:hypothetical protein
MEEKPFELTPELEDKIIKEAANDFANDLVVIASNANMTVQEIFDGLGKKLKKINEKRQARIKLLELDRDAHLG